MSAANPTETKKIAGLSALGGTTIGLGAYFIPLGYFLILLCVVILTLLIIWLFFRFRDRSRAKALTTGLSSQAATVPRGVTDPNKRAQLDGLRQTFNKGLQRVIEEGKRKGIDYLYRHPWLLMIGDSGAGKTEIIRHSNLGFAAGSEMEFMGVGGTLNMDWAFSDQAVILDTAGRLLMEEVIPGQNNEWSEFLKLLAKHRKLTPINGLLLVISAETLTTEDESKQKERAVRARSKLTEIQNALKIRFPVYVVISKCDKIQGFREFFDRMSDGVPSNQMLGWSKPPPLDEPFSSESFVAHFDNVIRRLKRFRTSHLTEIFAHSAEDRTIDATDSLYEFPDALSGLREDLKTYLDIVFTSGEWSSSAPLFIRGVYFCSALREGAVLDNALAQALGINVADFSKNTGFRTEKTLFVRDLFAKKIIPERGLITGHARADGIVRRRQIITISTLAAVCTITTAVFWYGHRTLKRSIGSELDEWRAVAANRTRENLYLPIFTRSPGSKVRFETMPEIIVGNASIPRVEFQARLERLTRLRLNIPFAYRMISNLGTDVDSLRRSAQQTVFETGVVVPMIGGARSLLVEGTGSWTDKETKTLLSLIRLEENIFRGERIHPKTQDVFDVFLKEVVNFRSRTSGSGPNDDLLSEADIKTLRFAFDSTYTAVHGMDLRWPTPGLTGGATLETNQPISSGIDHLIQAYNSNLNSYSSAIETLTDIRDGLRTLTELENGLPNAVMSRNDEGLFTKWESALDRYLLQVQRIDQLIAKGTKQTDKNTLPLIDPEKPSLVSSFQKLVERSNQLTSSLKQIIPASNVAGINATGEANEDEKPKLKIPSQIMERLGSFEASVKNRIEHSFSTKELSELDTLDNRFLTLSPTKVRALTVRSEALLTLKKSLAQRQDGTLDLIGRINDLLATDSANASAAGDGLPPPVAQARREMLLDLYITETEGIVSKYMRLPIVLEEQGAPLTTEDILTFADIVSSIQTDLSSLPKQFLSGRHKERFERLGKSIGKIRPVVDALIRTDHRLVNVSVDVPSYADQKSVLESIIGSDSPSKIMASSFWKEIGTNGKRLRIDNGASLGKCSINAGDLSLLFYRYPEDKDPSGPTVHPLKNWQILNWLKDSKTKRSDDGRTWLVVLSLKDSYNTPRFLVLQLHFDIALPEAENWPVTSPIPISARKQG